jgi:hypothetical protein
MRKQTVQDTCSVAPTKTSELWWRALKQKRKDGARDVTPLHSDTLRLVCCLSRVAPKNSRLLFAASALKLVTPLQRVTPERLTPLCRATSELSTPLHCVAPKTFVSSSSSSRTRTFCFVFAASRPSLRLLYVASRPNLGLVNIASRPDWRLVFATASRYCVVFVNTRSLSLSLSLSLTHTHTHTHTHTQTFVSSSPRWV